MAVDINLLLSQIRELSKAQQEHVLREVSVEIERARRLERLVQEQGTQPFKGLDDFSKDTWPEEESAEDFVKWSRQQRAAAIEKELDS